MAIGTPIRLALGLSSYRSLYWLRARFRGYFASSILQLIASREKEMCLGRLRQSYLSEPLFPLPLFRAGVFRRNEQVRFSGNENP